MEKMKTIVSNMSGINLSWNISSTKGPPIIKHNIVNSNNMIRCLKTYSENETEGLFAIFLRIREALAYLTLSTHPVKHEFATADDLLSQLFNKRIIMDKTPLIATLGIPSNTITG
jgi:hypothetical protein